MYSAQTLRTDSAVVCTRRPKEAHVEDLHCSLPWHARLLDEKDILALLDRSLTAQHADAAAYAFSASVSKRALVDGTGNAPCSARFWIHCEVYTAPCCGYQTQPCTFFLVVFSPFCAYTPSVFNL